MNPRLEAALSSILTLCAIAIASVVVYRQLTPPGGAVSSQVPVEVENWSILTEGARWIGSADAAVRLVEFGDFQCPFCRVLHNEFEKVAAEYPGQVALAFQHYPLPMHADAEAAAFAADCAERQSAFPEFVNALYSYQDSIGKKSWSWFALQAGVPALATFELCINTDTSRARFDSVKSRSKTLSIQGTPTVVINGWRLPQPPNADTLRRIARDVLAGRSPYAR